MFTLGDIILGDAPLGGGFSDSGSAPAETFAVLAYVSDSGVRWIVKASSVKALHETPSVDVLTPVRTWIRS